MELGRNLPLILTTASFVRFLLGQCTKPITFEERCNEKSVISDWLRIIVDVSCKYAQVHR